MCDTSSRVEGTIAPGPRISKAPGVARSGQAPRAGPSKLCVGHPPSSAWSGCGWLRAGCCACGSGAAAPSRRHPGAVSATRAPARSLRASRVSRPFVLSADLGTYRCCRSRTLAVLDPDHVHVGSRARVRRDLPGVGRRRRDARAARDLGCCGRVPSRAQRSIHDPPQAGSGSARWRCRCRRGSSRSRSTTTPTLSVAPDPRAGHAWRRW